MISACRLNDDDTLSVIAISTKEPIPSDVIWLDVNQPDDDERSWLETLFVEDVPEEDEMDDIESSSRFRVGPDGVHILSLFPQRLANETRGVNMSFTMRKNLLILIWTYKIVSKNTFHMLNSGFDDCVFI